MGLTDNSWPLKYMLIIIVFISLMGISALLFNPLAMNDFKVIDETSVSLDGNNTIKVLNIWDIVTNPYMMFDILTYGFLPIELRIAFNIVTVVIVTTFVYLGIAFVKGIFPFSLIMGGA
jgi:hypothetical protein